ncbi:unnamed protein product [Ilex paraguariensis]|uniref:Uncharacterized protein n=1 Tax=Ilex paraguariensis TaxID=185542 RepID=A0ABC8RAR6_9AQUA
MRMGMDSLLLPTEGSPIKRRAGLGRKQAGREMGSPFHQALRSLCFNTEWKYSIFWNLKQAQITGTDGKVSSLLGLGYACSSTTLSPIAYILLFGTSSNMANQTTLSPIAYILLFWTSSNMANQTKLVVDNTLYIVQNCSRCCSPSSNTHYGSTVNYILIKTVAVMAVGPRGLELDA